MVKRRRHQSGKPQPTSTINMDKAELAFSLVDKNTDGNVNKKEFEKMCKSLPKEEADKLFDSIDMNNDGEVALFEFDDMMETRKKK